ncbi:hypothetical protein BT67DRAFT_434456 [Trichocladium antarcticum]|uniref:PAP-associated domain-containing protein n=1 Tax=Trichocladium antarcticum TaxID=1450529 RepID=A0AAN6UMD9_9PEZI|nr:hypothetical protein BT67DRAFT_434456 [Trichocladium antarcticum]
MHPPSPTFLNLLLQRAQLSPALSGSQNSLAPNLARKRKSRRTFSWHRQFQRSTLSRLKPQGQERNPARQLRRQETATDQDKMTAGQAGGVALEERLRGLILNNSEVPNTSAQSPRQTAAQPAQAGPGSPSSPPSTRDATASSRGNRGKRLNQAQRRQMSAQLSIPVDTRPGPHQSAGAHAGPGYQGPGQQRGGRGQYRSRGRHPGTSRPPGGGNAVLIPGAPPTGQPFPSHTRHQPSNPYNGPMSTAQHSNWRQPPLHHGDPRMQHQMPQPMSSFSPMPFGASSQMPPGQGRSNLAGPGRPFHARPDDARAQIELLEGLCNTIIVDAEIEHADIMEKENFRAMIENVARSAIAEYERNQNGVGDFPAESVQLKCFGSLSSGFATKAADMDLGLLSPLSRVPPDASGSPIPRIIEKAFLDIGLGARLLTRTRVPIIKVCERPSGELRLSLLEERAKWEKSGSAEDVEDDELHDEHDPHPAEDHHIQSREDSLTREQRLQSLKQTETCTLSTYYGAAKRLLRKLGGRDLTNSSISDFNQQDFKLLNEVCLAFVDGLADSKLRERLLRTRSLNRYDLTAQSSLRSLVGVFTQIEGETTAMAWESRRVREMDEPRETTAAENALRAWGDIQNKADYGRDPLGYQKELQLMAEQLRKVPSIQVLFLAQSQHESATKYFYRAKRLLADLGGYDSPTNANPMLPVVIQHYIQGIWNHDIREQVGSFAEPQALITLRDVGRRHRSLQLAHEYETCLRKGLYPEESEAAVRRYIDLLRAPMATIQSTTRRSDTIVPLPSDSASLLSEMRLLGDPSAMAPNQPKDRYSNSLEFPNSGVGVQCDVNFSAHLALHNTLLLRCYSHCDPRVRPLVLFVKHWAKVRRINTPYRGTLSSYGYVLMVLHYLVNIAQPFVCPNLQQLAPPPNPNLDPRQADDTVTCRGYNVRFWRDEAGIQRLARDNVLTQNREPVGQLLRGFFEYYAKGGNTLTAVPGARGFDWGRDVISMRTHGGLLNKQQKGWTGAKTVVEVMPADSAAAGDGENTTHQAAPADGAAAAAAAAAAVASVGGSVAPPPQQGPAKVEVKEVRYRYLFAIEDPFELDHNVARTVTHSGIVNIRDEFRRAWRIIMSAGGRGPGHGPYRQEDLLEDVSVADEARERDGFARLLEELHGLERAGGENGAGVGKEAARAAAVLGPLTAAQPLNLGTQRQDLLVALAQVANQLGVGGCQVGDDGREARDAAPQGVGCRMFVGGWPYASFSSSRASRARVSAFQAFSLSTWSDISCCAASATAAAPGAPRAAAYM